MARMVRAQPYTLVYAAAVGQHLRAIELKYHTLIRDKIQQQLSFEPDVETMNRKPLTQPAGLDATWELRLGPTSRFRVFYDVDSAKRTVEIVAIGVKERNRLRIGGVEIEL
jgi:mRNA-degrading endonuclease RelE of RelBE toxin-antitoxin system